jgi:hypothetical protein
MQDLAWPEDWNVVPPWRLKQERRAVELGIRIPAYRTKQEFHDAAQRCLERLEPNVELKLEPQVEQGVSTHRSIQGSTQPWNPIGTPPAFHRLDLRVA